MTKDTRFLGTLHGALMPDYNRAAATYWWALIVVGAAVLAVATYTAAPMTIKAHQ